MLTHNALANDILEKNKDEIKLFLDNNKWALLLFLDNNKWESFIFRRIALYDILKKVLWLKGKDFRWNLNLQKGKETTINAKYVSKYKQTMYFFLIYLKRLWLFKRKILGVYTVYRFKKTTTPYDNNCTKDVGINGSIMLQASSILYKIVFY